MWKFSSLKRSRVNPATGERYGAAPVYCGRVAHGTHVSVSRTTDLETGDVSAEAHGLQSCRSIWACPECSGSIRAARASDLVRLVGAHLEQGGALLFVTLTVRHRLGDDLGALLDGLNVAWNRTLGSDRWARDMRERIGWVGAPRALEITYGGNGWHPHLHALVFLDRPMTDNARKALEGELAARWSDRVERLLGARPSKYRGCRIEPVRSAAEAGRYIAKVQDDHGHEQDQEITAELLRGDLKQARRHSLVPFQLLDLIDHGADHDPRQCRSCWALRLWREYEQATKGRRCITGLTPLLRLYGLEAAPDDCEPDLEALLEDPSVVVVTHRLHPSAWWHLCAAGLEVEYLEAVELGGFAFADATVLALSGAPPGG